MIRFDHLQNLPVLRIIEPSSENQSHTILYRAGGDSILASGVAQHIEWADSSFVEIANMMHSADIAHLHFEHMFSTKTEPYSPHVQRQLRSDPQLWHMWRELGIDVMDLASNHTLDWGATGITETRELLSRAEIDSVGAGQNLAEATTPVIVERNGIRLGFLGYSAKATYFHATLTSPGAAPFRLAEVIPTIKELKKRVHHVIIAVHWGIEFTEYPLPGDRAAAQAMVEAGASVVIGTHPHVPQGIEVYRNGIICYSLGHFLYDPLSDESPSPKMMEQRYSGLLLECWFTEDRIAEALAYPLQISKTSLPAIARGEGGERLCQCILSLSRDLDSKVGSAGFYEQAVVNLWSRTLYAYRALWHRAGAWYTIRTMIANLKPRYFVALGGFLASRLRRLVTSRIRG